MFVERKTEYFKNSNCSFATCKYNVFKGLV